MKKVLICLSLLLCACGGPTATETAVGNLNNQINVIETTTDTLHETLPEACRTEAVEVQFKNIYTQIDNLRYTADSVLETHETETRELENELANYRFFLLMLIVCGVSLVVLRRD